MRITVVEPTIYRMKTTKPPVQFDPFAERFLDTLCGEPGSPFATRSELAQFCEISPNALYSWRVNGVPKVWLRYFYALYPYLYLALNVPEPFPTAAPTDPALVALFVEMGQLRERIKNMTPA